MTEKLYLFCQIGHTTIDETESFNMQMNENEKKNYKWRCC